MTSTLLPAGVAQTLGWVLVHFVWQGCAIAGALALVRLAAPERAARVRYAAACVALLAMLAAPIASFAVLHVEATGAGIESVPVAVADEVALETTALGPVAPVVASAVDGGWLDGARGRLEAAVPWLLVPWLIGVCLLSLRLARGWVAARRFARVGCEPVGPGWLDALARLRGALGVSRPVRLVASAVAEVPSVVGWLRPVVVMPVAVLAGMAPAQIEAILAHELAHVRRHDYLVNLLQSVVETLLFYHPAVWWVSRQIREERERCSDDVAVELCGDPAAYVRALAELEALRSPALAVAATGGSLLGRARRLLAPADSRRSSLSVAAAVALALSICAWAGASADSAHADALVESASSMSPIPPAPPVPASSAPASTPAPPRPPMPASPVAAWPVPAPSVPDSIPAHPGTPMPLSPVPAWPVPAPSVPDSLPAHPGMPAPTPSVPAATPARPGSPVPAPSVPAATSPRPGSPVPAPSAPAATPARPGSPVPAPSVPAPPARPGSPVPAPSVPDAVPAPLGAPVPLAASPGAPPSPPAPPAAPRRGRSVGDDSNEPDLIDVMNELGYRRVPVEQLISLGVHGVTRAWVREMNGLGFGRIPVERLLDLKIHGVTPAYVRDLRAAGAAAATTAEVLSMKIQGVSPAYVREVRAAGATFTTTSELVTMKIHGVSPEFVRKARRVAGGRLTAARLVELRIHGVIR